MIGCVSEPLAKSVPWTCKPVNSENRITVPASIETDEPGGTYTSPTTWYFLSAVNVPVRSPLSSVKTIWAIPLDTVMTTILTNNLSKFICAPQFQVTENYTTVLICSGIYNIPKLKITAKSIPWVLCKWQRPVWAFHRDFFTKQIMLEKHEVTGIIARSCLTNLELKITGLNTIICRHFLWVCNETNLLFKDKRRNKYVINQSSNGARE